VVEPALQHVGHEVFVVQVATVIAAADRFFGRLRRLVGAGLYDVRPRFQRSDGGGRFRFGGHRRRVASVRRQSGNGGRLHVPNRFGGRGRGRGRDGRFGRCGAGAAVGGVGQVAAQERPLQRAGRRFF